MKTIELRNITKIYPGNIVANDNVDFDLRVGEIHTLLGENGAGKTTLMKIMGGCLAPTKGSIFINGRRVVFKSPLDALRNGVGMVHQQFTLIQTMTVLENIKLGFTGQKVDEDSLLRDFKDISSKLSFQLRLDLPVYMLSTGEKQKVEILRLLLKKARILIFDEPTSMLCGSEIDKFLEMLKSLTLEGYSIALTTHKVQEALQVSDRITVMRRGRVIATLNRGEVKDKYQLIELMIGEKVIPEAVRRRAHQYGEPLLVVRNLTVKDDQDVVRVRNVSFEVYRGEILGIAGVEGNGQKELVEAIVGFRKPSSGTIVFKSGVKLGFIPAERDIGVALPLSLAINSVINSLSSYKRRFGALNMAGINEFARRLTSFMSIKTPSLNIPLKHLSGGNIQRVVVGREMLSVRDLLIAEQPTAGLDAKLTYFVRKTLTELASSGVGVVVVSSDLDEIIELSDRVAIIRNGEIVKVLSRGEIDLKLIGEYML